MTQNNPKSLDQPGSSAIRQQDKLIQTLAGGNLGPEAAALMLDGQPIPAFVLGADHRVLVWNRALENLTGLAAREMVGSREQWRAFHDAPQPLLADLLIEGDQSLFAKHYPDGRITRSSSIPGAWQTTARFKNLGGAARYIYFLAAPLTNQAGERLGAIQTLLDLTRLDQVSEALAASEERYRALFDRVADGLAVIQGKRMIMVNPALAKIGGLPRPEDLVGKSVLQFVDPTQRAQTLAELAALESGQSQSGIFLTKITGVDMREHWLEGHYSGISWEGRPAVLAMIRDVTHRQSREEAIKRRAKDLRLENLSLRSSLGERYRFGDLVGKSQKMQEVYELILQAAESEAGVIVYGESGTGKELVARSVHENSSRRGQEFVAVNCGAVPAPLLESEFFGYQKGAFTGAHMDKHGFLDLADRGTLFLDEVGELTLDLQVKLLRAIERGEYTPLGANSPKSSRFRVVAATNRRLPELVARGDMRGDFYYRIHIIPIEMPPLRERREDIPLLADHFLRRAGLAEGAAALSGEVMESLFHHRWPGNVRELANAIERWLATGRLQLGHGEPAAAVGLAAPEATPPAAEAGSAGGEVGNLALAAREFERGHILRALSATRWSRVKAAKLLGVSRKTLFRKMQSLGLGQ